MGPPHRHHSPSSDSSAPTQSPVAQRPSAASQQSFGMSPASRYQHNLKVLRRRDPSILSIFDQFSHVCLYHHNGQKWEKHGYEGSMFLYERDSYPPYGFYILNRMGMDDHIQRLYPEDNIGAHSSYLIIRSYPEFTARRLAAARASATPDMVKHKFSPIYTVPDVDKLTGPEKGDSETIGLWMFTTDSREPLFDVFSRLHSYIKKNAPYPQEFRYGPDRPRPLNLSSRQHTVAPPQHSGDNSPTSTSATHQPFVSQEKSYHSSRSNGKTEGISELDKLFARLEPTSAAVAPASSEASTSTSKMTVETLFAALGSQDLSKPADVPTSPTPSRSSTSSTGISLLDDIFASATPSKLRTQQRPPSRTDPESITIYSPVPTSNDLPQILSQDVICTLMGLPPSRTPSSASAHSSSAQSHPSSREGDNEDESDHASDSRMSDGGYSESSTVLDPEAEFDEELQAAGASAGRRLFAEGALRHTSSNSYLASTSKSGRVQGDVTPRPPQFHGFASSAASSARPDLLTRHPSVMSLPPSLMSENSTSTVIAGPIRSKSEPKLKGRSLVPFESDSELWPYPGNNHPSKAKPDAGSSGGDSDEVLELDFEDMSVLSDPDVFKKGIKTQNRSAASQSHNDGIGIINGKEKGKGKEGRKERALKARQEIENSWDVPEHMTRVGPGSSGVPATVANLCRLNGRTARNDIASVGGETTEEEEYTARPASIARLPRQAKIVEQRTAVIPAKPAVALNGNINGFGGHAKPSDAVVDANAVRDSLVLAVAGHGGVKTGLERNDFVREVLTLLHTDKTFVDSLWKEYTTRVA